MTNDFGPVDCIVELWRSALQMLSAVLNFLHLLCVQMRMLVSYCFCQVKVLWNFLNLNNEGKGRVGRGRELGQMLLKLHSVECGEFLIQRN